MVFNPAVGSARYASRSAGFALFCKFAVREDGKGEGAALVDLATDRDLATVCQDDSAAKVETEAGAAYLRTVSVVAVEFIEDVRPVSYTHLTLPTSDLV